MEALEYYECPIYGKRVFDRDAMQRIEAQSLAIGTAWEEAGGTGSWSRQGVTARFLAQQA